MELRDYVRVLRKRWRLISWCTLGSLAAALALTLLVTPQYRTGLTFFVSTPAQPSDTSSAYTGGLFSQQRVKSYAKVVASRSTAERIAIAANLPADSVNGAIQAAAVADTVLLNVTVTNPSRTVALRIAQTLADEFPKIVDELERPATGGQPAIHATLTERPILPDSAFTPKPIRNLTLALMLGLLLGIGLAVMRDALDNTVKSPEDVREHSGTATLGAITYDPNASKRPLIVHDKPRAARAEAFRQLRTNLQFIELDAPLRSFVITSSVPNEGKSTMACNLAISLAQADISVCLVEGDLRRPRIADYLGVEGAVGLTNVVIGKVSLEDALQSWGDGMLSVLASGPLPPNPSELLSSNGMLRLLEDLEHTFDIVIVDAPPLLPVTDAAILATITNGAVMAVRSGSTKKEQLRRATEALIAVDAAILGTVLNMVPRRGPDAYYSYGYGGYGASYESDLQKPRLTAAEARVRAQAGVQESLAVPSATAPSNPQASAPTGPGWQSTPSYYTPPHPSPADSGRPGRQSHRVARGVRRVACERTTHDDRETVITRSEALHRLRLARRRMAWSKDDLPEHSGEPWRQRSGSVVN